MSDNKRHSGLKILGDIPWSTHFCQFYETQDDLLEVLVPYFKAGLTNNEFCMWITTDPLDVNKAEKAMAKAMPDFSRYQEKGQIEIIPYDHWYRMGGQFDSNRVLNGWIEKLEKATGQGFDGLRLTDNTFWLEKKDWNDFTSYEADVNTVIGRYDMIGLCTYCLDKCDAKDIIDVIRSHEFAIIKRFGKWEIIETAQYKKTKNSLVENENKYRRETLLLEKQHKELEVINEQLRETQGLLLESNAKYESLWDLSPVGRVTLDLNNVILEANITAAGMLGVNRRELISQVFGEFIVSTYQASYQEHVENILTSGAAQKCEIEMLSHGGSHYFIHLESCPIFDRSGNVTKITTALVNTTEQRQALNALAENESRLTRLYESMSEGMAVHDIVFDETGKAVDYIITDVNPLFEKITGIKKIEALNTKASVLYGIQEPPYLDIYSKVAETGLPDTFETYFPPMDKYFHIAVFSPKKGTFATVFSDITDTKKAESALRARETELTAIYQSVPLLILTVDSERRVLKANRAAAELADRRIDDMNGLRAGEALRCLHSADNPAGCGAGAYCQTCTMRLAVQSTLDSGKPQYGVESKLLIERNGIIHEMSVLIDTFLLDLPGKQVLVCVQDVTARRKMEADLRQSQHDLERAQQVALIGSWRLNILRNELIWSNETYRIFEIPIGTPMTYDSFLSAVYPDDKDDVNRCWNGALAGAPYDIEHRINAGDKIKWVREKAELDFNQEGQLIGGFGTVQDITERKNIEQEIEKQRQELMRSNKDLEHFAYVASHDLQEPLRMVSSFMQLLAKRYQDKLDKDANDFIYYAVDGARRMQTLINDLLTYSRLNTRAVEFSPVNMDSILSQVLSDLKIAIENNQALVTCDHLPTVSGDATQLAQIFQNLVDNALKFKGNKPPQIHIGVREDSSSYIFSVKDNGIGIDQQYFDRIFVLFQRLHHHDEYPGTGIGLAVCKKIVERHGGRIWVESTPGENTTFFFSLPHYQLPDRPLPDINNYVSGSS